MATQLTIPEALSIVLNKNLSKEQRLQQLRVCPFIGVKKILEFALDPTVKPPADLIIPVYKQDDSPTEMSYSSLHTDWKLLYNFVEPKASQIGKKRISELLVQLLEAVSKPESDIIVALLLGKFDTGDFTLAEVRATL